jgi:multidrug resistance efflux pump
VIPQPQVEEADADGIFTSVTQRIPVQITLADEQGLTLYPGESATVTIHPHDR